MVQLVICGCLLGKQEAPAGPVDPKAASRLAGPLKEADVLLTQLAASMPVDVMPGPGDPSNQALPQQPLHGCLLPSGARYNTLRQCTNPHDFEVAGVQCAPPLFHSFFHRHLCSMNNISVELEMKRKGI